MRVAHQGPQLQLQQGLSTWWSSDQRGPRGAGGVGAHLDVDGDIPVFADAVAARHELRAAEHHARLQERRRLRRGKPAGLCVAHLCQKFDNCECGQCIYWHPDNNLGAAPSQANSDVASSPRSLTESQSSRSLTVLILEGSPACRAWSPPRDGGGCHAGAAPTTRRRWGTGPRHGGRSALATPSEEPSTHACVSRLAYIKQL